jgi:enterochelin esterase-like enzyme
MKRNSFLLMGFVFLAGCRMIPGLSLPTRTIAKPACTSGGSTRTVSVAAHLEIVIYLPPCYVPQSKHLYPTLYLLPGFSGTAHDWFNSGVEKLADAAILNGDIAPFLIVGAPDTFDDLDARVVYETILPYIEDHYPTAADRRYRAAAGGSYGGAAAYHLALKHPDLFSSAGIFGNGAARGEEDSIRAWLAATPKNIKPRVFINVGESDTYMLQRAKVLVPILEAGGVAQVDIFSPGGHNYAYWLGNFPAFFHFLAQIWR